MKPDPAFLNENPLDYLENQKKLNPCLLKKEVNNRENHENDEEKNEKLKKNANNTIDNGEKNIENQKNEANYFETFLNNEINKLKNEFQMLKDDQEIISKNFVFENNSVETNKQINDFFQTPEIFANYLKSKENERILPLFKEKFLRILINMSKNEEENENLVKNLLVIVPKAGKLLVFTEEKTVVIETKSNDIEEKFQGVFNDLLIIS